MHIFCCFQCVWQLTENLFTRPGWFGKLVHWNSASSFSTNQLLCPRWIQIWTHSQLRVSMHFSIYWTLDCCQLIIKASLHLHTDCLHSCQQTLMRIFHWQSMRQHFITKHWSACRTIRCKKGYLASDEESHSGKVQTDECFQEKRLLL